MHVIINMIIFFEILTFFYIIVIFNGIFCYIFKMSDNIEKKNLGESGSSSRDTNLIQLFFSL